MLPGSSISDPGARREELTRATRPVRERRQPSKPLARLAAVVSHCMFEELSAPPHQRTCRERARYLASGAFHIRTRRSRHRLPARTPRASRRLRRGSKRTPSRLAVKATSVFRGGRGTRGRSPRARAWWTAARSRASRTGSCEGACRSSERRMEPWARSCSVPERVERGAIEPARLEPPRLTGAGLGAEGEQPSSVDADPPAQLLEPFDANDVIPDLLFRIACLHRASLRCSVSRWQAPMPAASRPGP